MLLWIGSEDHSDKYYVVSLSVSRFAKVRSGRVTLWQAFKDSEDGTVVVLSVGPGGHERSTATLKSDELQQDLLPDPGEALDLAPLTPHAVKNTVASGRGVLELDFSFSSVGEPPTRQIASCLRSFEELLRAATGTRGYRLAQTYVVGIAIGSLVVQVAPKAAKNDGERGAQEEFIETALRLLSAKGSDLSELLTSRGRLNAYKKFLASMAHGPESLKLNWVSGNRERRGSVELTSREAETLLRELRLMDDSGHRLLEAAVTEADQLPPAVVERLLPPGLREAGFIIGVFKLIDLENLRFAAYIPEQQTVFRGHISLEAVPAVQRVTLNNPYALTLRKRGSAYLLTGLHLAAP